MEKYSLSGHKWLQSLYAGKEIWIGAYSKRFFAAGMTTSSRRKGMNNFFDEYDSSITSIKDFVFSSQKALEK